MIRIAYLNLIILICAVGAKECCHVCAHGLTAASTALNYLYHHHPLLYFQIRCPMLVFYSLTKKWYILK